MHATCCEKWVLIVVLCIKQGTADRGRRVALPDENLSARSSYNETPLQSPDANEYFGRWDSRTPSPAANEHQKVTFEEP